MSELPTFPRDFTYVLIPADETLPYEERTATAKAGGDTLHELLKPHFGSASRLNTDALRSEYGVQVDKQMSKLEKAAAEGTVELLALTKPGKTTLPYKMTGTYIYMDEMGALKERPHNRRAAELARACGLDMEHGIPGDVFVGRVAIEPIMYSVSFGADELDSSCAWIRAAPSENALFAQAMDEYHKVAKQKQVGAKSEEQTRAEEDERGWRWDQSTDDLEVTVTVPEGTRAREMDIEITAYELKVGIRGGKTLAHLRLFGNVCTDDSTWTMGKDARGEHVQVSMDKMEPRTWPTLEKR